MQSNLKFEGTGGQLFVKLLGYGLLTMITFGIYGPWMMVNILKWIAENAKVGAAPVQFFGTGGALFVQFIVIGILTSITFGIYSAWGNVRLLKWTYENARVGA